MSAGVSDQRMKGQGNQVNVSKEQLESPGEELVESWRHQQQAPSYVPPISTQADPYSAQGYYGTAGTAAFPYQAFGVGDGTWSTNGTDPITFLGSYAQHDTYGMEGVFGPTTTAFSAANFNYSYGNGGDYSTWGGQLGRAKQLQSYDDYYPRQDGLYMSDTLKGVESLSLSEAKERDKEGGGGAPKKTWATIASQPAKPQPAQPPSTLKKKGPGMPPPPIIPGKHNMDIGTWDTGKSNGPSVSQAPPAQQAPPVQQAPPQHHVPPPKPLPSPQPPAQQQVVMPQQQLHAQHTQHTQHTQHAAQAVQHVAQTAVQARPPWAPPQRALQLPTPPLPHPVLDELKVKNNYNPPELDLGAPNARFFVIKSYSEDDIHRSIKYEIWCSTEHGNKRLDTAFREREKEQGLVYLFFSVNGSGHFCGMAQMVSAVDYDSNSSVWSQDKWKGQFKVRWIYVKDVPNVQLRHIRLENNENKPVTNSRDTQEVPHAKGLQVLRMMHGYRHSTSIFDDFIHYEKRQEEEDQRKVPEPPAHQPGHHQGYEGKPHHGGGGYEKHDSYGGGKGNYNRDHGGNFNRDHGGGNFNKDHGYNKDHGSGFNKDHHGGGGFNKDHHGGGGFHKDHHGGGGGFNKDHHSGGGFNKEHHGGGGYNKDHHGGFKDHGGYKEHGGYKDHGNNGDSYGGYNKGHRGGDREQHGGYREPRGEQQGGYRPHHAVHKDRGEGPRGGRGRGRPN